MGVRSIAPCAALLLLACSQQSDDIVPKRADEPVTKHSEAASFRRVGNPFPEASEVRLFVDSGEYDGRGRAILSSTEGRRLTDAQRTAFEAALRIEPMPDALDACFIPHHFFGYFDRNGRKVGEIEVCFCCEGVAVEPVDQVSLRSNEILSADYAALKRLVQSMGERTDIECS